MTDETQHEILTGTYRLEYTYRRSLGPILSRFFTGLRDGKIVGVRTGDGRVIVPPQEYDPETGDGIDEIVEVGTSGVVTTWSWVYEPREKHPLDHPFAFALIKLDGADTPMLHVVDAGDISNMKTGMRVNVRWREKRIGEIHDIEAFEPG
jgi:uncharacterized OB-fold protein